MPKMNVWRGRGYNTDVYQPGKPDRTRKFTNDTLRQGGSALYYMFTFNPWAQQLFFQTHRHRLRTYGYLCSWLWSIAWSKPLQIMTTRTCELQIIFSIKMVNDILWNPSTDEQNRSCKRSLQDEQENPGGQTRAANNRPFAASHSRGTKPPRWRAKVALGQDKQKTYIILNGNFLCLSCPSATFALQHGGFVPREWLAAKGLLSAFVF